MSLVIKLQYINANLTISKELLTWLCLLKPFSFHIKSNFKAKLGRFGYVLAKLQNRTQLTLACWLVAMS